MEPKHIHFIGICGVAMSALAIAFKNAGWHVPGSDVGFFPPISTYLEKNNIAFYPGWHVEKMIARGTPDLIVVGNVAGSTNPEFVFAQTNNLHYKSYPEVVAEYIVAQHSLVCAGTYGKTSSAALLTYILQQNGFDPSYMFGGLSSNIPDSAHINSNKEGWSVLEGDEYKTARWDNRPKFALYSPTHLLLTAVSWDHADVYPTEESYINTFKTLLASVPENGLIVACTDAEKITELTTNAVTKARVISYGKNKTAEYRYDNISQTTDGLHFNIYHNTQEYTIHSAVLGAHMAENICGAFAMAAEIGIDTNIIVQSIANFTGIKRRLEKKYEGFITIYDDLAHSPAKASATLKTLKFIYPTNNIIAIFEPNTGNRKSQSIPGYAHAFVDANEVIIPTLTKLKVDEKDTDPPFDGRALCDIIAKNHTHALYIENDPALLAYIKEHAKKEDVVVFLGSHGFRGMIDELVRSYEGK